MRRLLFMFFAAGLFTGCAVRHRAVVTPLPPDSALPQSRGTADFTAGRSAICDIHKTEMSVQLVKLEFGLKIPTRQDEARWHLFPHADEPYDTGYCVPLMQQYGRVFVCLRCTEARTRWLSTNKPARK